MNSRILNLMQFSRKAGKLVPGLDACVRGINHNVIRLIIMAEDTSVRTQNNLVKANSNNPSPVKIIITGTQQEISYALGLPITGVFGISDKNFAAKILEYWKAEA